MKISFHCCNIDKIYYWVIYMQTHCTWLCGNSLICFSLKTNGTGMNKNKAIRNTQPVTTPIASGLEVKKKIIRQCINCTTIISLTGFGNTM